MNSAVVNLGGSGPCHIHYVALSRVTKLDNLYIENLNKKQIKIDVKVHEEYNRLRNEANLQICLPFVTTNQANILKIIYHNIQSLQ